MAETGSGVSGSATEVLASLNVQQDAAGNRERLESYVLCV